MADRTVLVSGAGIAGSSLAYWLVRYGYRPTLVEIAPALPQGGYMVDFWGVGYDAAEKMDLLPALRRVAYNIGEIRMVDRHGTPIGGFDTRALQAAAGDRFFSILRSDLAHAIFKALDGKVETIFGDHITAIEQDDAGVQVSFGKSQARRFDIVVGADGLHSAVRSLQFGDEDRFEKYLGYYVASFGVADYLQRDESAYVSYTTAGRQVARYALRGNRTVFVFIWIEDAKLDVARHDINAQKQLLRARFRSCGWECDAILEALDASEELYFDSVSQIRMSNWWRNRVALVGDAAYCLSLLAGEGAALAMAGAYVLAGELHRMQADHEAAFRNYDQSLRSYIDYKQRSALRLGHWFAPKTRAGVLVRNQITRMMSWPWIGRRFLGSMLGESFRLPTY
ncbi:MAG: FAD-binding domain [Rhizobiales bacterium]|nr:FAD-binding domain [Hyphomicrobiales bacterium]